MAKFSALTGRRLQMDYLFGKDANRFNVIYVYSIENAQKIQVTENWIPHRRDVFSNDGKYWLRFPTGIFNPIYSQTELEPCISGNEQDLHDHDFRGPQSHLLPRIMK
jgi:hypothetical protein